MKVKWRVRGWISFDELNYFIVDFQRINFEKIDFWLSLQKAVKKYEPVEENIKSLAVQICNIIKRAYNCRPFVRRYRHIRQRIYRRRELYGYWTPSKPRPSVIIYIFSIEKYQNTFFRINLLYFFCYLQKNCKISYIRDCERSFVHVRCTISVLVN